MIGQTVSMSIGGGILGGVYGFKSAVNTCNDGQGSMIFAPFLVAIVVPVSSAFGAAFGAVTGAIIEYSRLSSEDDMSEAKAEFNDCIAMKGQLELAGQYKAAGALTCAFDTAE